MGYTHYWDNVEFSREQWNRVKVQAEKIIRATTIPVQYEYDEVRPLSEAITDEQIRFNGVEDDGHETFHIKRTGSDWSFCKTALKPYDEVVVAMLVMLVAENDNFSWRSDGDPADFEDGIALYDRAVES